ncbi:MAG: GAF domain-containing protein, partial [Chloroflexi bacterium]|nr:GAF domain-containing protein [Chloroflexota bacterium]
MNDDQKTKEQLLESLKLERERSLALQAVSKKVAATHDTDEILDLIVNETARLVGAEFVYLRLLEGDELVLLAAVGDSDTVGYIREAIPRLEVGDGGGMAGHVMATGKPVFGEDATEKLHPEARRVIEEGGRDPAVIGTVPLLANGRSIGTLTVSDSQDHGRRFTEDEIALLMAFADQAALALEKARLLNEAEREKARSDALYRVSNLLAGAHNTDEVLDLIVNEAARLVGGAWMRLLEGEVLVPGPATASAAEFLDEVGREQPAIPVDMGSTIQGRVMATKTPFIWVDGEPLSEGAVTPFVLSMAQKLGFQKNATFPLLANDRSIGTLNVIDRSAQRFTEDEVSLLTAFADQAALALDKARLLDEAERARDDAEEANETLSHFLA